MPERGVVPGDMVNGRLRGAAHKDCPTRDVSVREGRDSYVLPAWKQSCDAVVKWDGKKFIYRRL
jgi:hypothetical protein